MLTHIDGSPAGDPETYMKSLERHLHPEGMERPLHPLAEAFRGAILDAVARDKRRAAREAQAEIDRQDY